MSSYMHVELNGMLRLLQGLVSAMLWQALQLLDHFVAKLHASKQGNTQQHVGVLVQGLVSAVLWQALQLLDQPRAALHASYAE